MEFRQTQLDNGLTILAEVNRAAASMAAGFFVQTGSRDECAELLGVSHFLEHMVFKGTARRSAADVNREFDEIGANYNAMTSEENTVYYAAVLPEFQRRAVDLLCDMMRPALRQEDFDVEKKVILDEIAVYQDQPRSRCYDRLMQTYFRGHPMGNVILGTAASVGALSRDDMLAYFSRQYSPGNLTAVGAGNLDFGAFADQIARACAQWRPAQTHRSRPPAPRRTAQELVVDPKVQREQIGIISSAPAAQDQARFAAYLATTVLGDSTGSRLFYALIEPAIADEAVAIYAPMDRVGALLTFVSADAHRAAEALRVSRRTLRKFADEGPTDAEMQAAKNKIASSATLRGELPMGRLAAVGPDWVYRREYVPLADQIETLMAVTRRQVLEVLREHAPTAMTVVGIGPVESL